MPPGQNQNQNPSPPTSAVEAPGKLADPFKKALSAATPPRVLFAAPEFLLTDQTGQPFGADQLRGRVWIANFIFTRCMATCPRQTARLAELQERLKNWPDWDRIRLLSISVDPEHDTVSQLHEYAKRHKADADHWKFLTGKREELFKLSKEGFKLPVGEDGDDEEMPITHSSKFVLVDAEMRIRGFYDGVSAADVLKLRTDLRLVLSEPTTKAQGTVHVGIPAEVMDPVWLEARAAAQLATADDLKVRHDFTFSDQLESSGIRFINRVVADAAKNWKPHHYDHGTGLAVADVDGDGLYDLYFVNQVGGNELWRNAGEGRFENITEQAGVGLVGRVSVSASFADTDNDGDPDLYVTTTRHGNAFFENDGRGGFKNITPQTGLEYSGHSSGAEFFDYDRDGRLDMFLTNIGRFTSDEVGYNGDPKRKEFPYFLGLDAAFGGHLFPERAEASILYHNEGGNRFRDVTKEMGLVDDAWSGDAAPFDANGDGWIDLYVLDMQGNDEYYENVEGRKFQRRSEQVFGEFPWGAMGVKPLDYNNDGRLDLFTTSMHADMFKSLQNGPEEKLKVRPDIVPDSMLQSRHPGKSIMGNAFYENQGSGKFKEVSDRINAETYWPWGLSVGDLNADGYQDVFITASMNMPFRYQTNSLLLNDRGRGFKDAEFILGVEPRLGGRTATPWFSVECAGADATYPLCQGRNGKVVAWSALGSRSSVILDLDQDGDLDIVTNDFGSAPMVLISNLSERHPDLHYLQIQLRGKRSNRDGLGAKVKVTAAGKTQTQEHDGQSGYLSQSVLSLYFGLDGADVVDQITVQWLGGKQQVLKGPIKTNQRLVIEEESPDGDEESPTAVPPTREPS